MNVPAAGQKRLVIVGATGMVGGYALRYALEHPAVGWVTSIGRRKLGLSNPKLDEVLHRDFADCSALTAALSGQDAAISDYPAFQLLFPNLVIPADDLARAMIDVVFRKSGETGGRVFENRDIRTMVESG